MGKFFAQEGGGGFAAAGGDGAFEVVPVLVGGDFAKEVGAVFKAHGVEEFVFDGVVDAFHIGVGVGALRRVKTM